MGGAVLQVQDPDTGDSYAIEESVYSANPDAYQLVEGQQIVLDPTSSAGAEAAFEASDVVGGPTVGRRLSASELGTETREQTEEDQYGGVYEKAKQVGRGALSAGTLGLSEYALTAGDTMIDREVDQAKRRVGAEYFAAGEIVGDVAVGALTGGGVVAGRVGAGVGRKAIASAADGAITELSSAIGRSALQDEPLSASSLASSMTFGALLGGGTSAAIGGVTRGAQALSDNLLRAKSNPSKFADLLRRGEDASLGRVADDMAKQSADGFRQVKLGRLFSKRGKAPELTRTAAAQLIEQVESRSMRMPSMRTALDDLEGAARAEGRELPAELMTRARNALADYDVVSKSAADAMPAFSKEVEGAIAGTIVKPSAELVPAMRAMDVADRDLASIFKDFQQFAPAAPQTAQPASMFSRAMDAIGSLEIAGIPGVSAIPGVGPMLGALAKARTAGRILDKASSVRNVASVRAATGVSKNADRLHTITSRIAKGAARLDSLPGVRRVVSMTPSLAARIWSDARSAQPEDLANTLATAYPDLPDDVRAQVADLAKRKLEYLEDVLPSPPPGLNFLMSDWQPSYNDTRRFSEIYAALDDPFGATGDVFSGRSMYSQSVVDALRDVYPAVYQEVQQSLLTNASAIVGSRSRSLAAEWGRMWAVPILPELHPSYSTPSAEPSMSASGGLATPPLSTSSPTATSLELTRPGRKS